MAKITVAKSYVEVCKEDGDPKKFRGGSWGDGESQFLHWLKGVLNKAPHNLGLIKKRMWKDGHLVSDEQQYLRTGNARKGQEYMMLWNDHYAITGLNDEWNEHGLVVLALERGTWQ
jgi:hypothetical protein